MHGASLYSRAALGIPKMHLSCAKYFIFVHTLKENMGILFEIHFIRIQVGAIGDI